MLDPQTWELLSYVVTVIGLPVAILIFFVEQRKQRANEEDEIQQLLADSYTGFLNTVVANPDLCLLSVPGKHDWTDEQRERALGLYDILISIFERAYILSYSPRTRGRRARYWRSWEDIMLEWRAREDFSDLLPHLLIGEDEAFANYITALDPARGVRPAWTASAQTGA